LFKSKEFLKNFVKKENPEEDVDNLDIKGGHTKNIRSNKQQQFHTSKGLNNILNLNSLQYLQNLPNFQSLPLSNLSNLPDLSNDPMYSSKIRPEVKNLVRNLNRMRTTKIDEEVIKTPKHLFKLYEK